MQQTSPDPQPALFTLSQTVAVPMHVAADVVQLTSDPVQQVVLSAAAHIGEYTHGPASIAFASITFATSLGASPKPASRRCRSKLRRPHATTAATTTTNRRTHPFYTGTSAAPKRATSSARAVSVVDPTESRRSFVSARASARAPSSPR
jgi:hypothetical protein